MNIPEVKLRHRKLKTGKSYFLDYTDPITRQRQRPSLGFVSHNEAVQIQQKKIAELKKLVFGIDVGPVETVGLSELFQRYIDRKESRGRADSSIKRYETYRNRAVSVITELVPHVESDVKVLSRAMYELALEKVQDDYDLANSTYNQFISFLKSVFEFGVEQNLLMQNPAKGQMSLPEEDLKEINYYSEEQLQKMWSVMPDDWRDLFQFLLLTGLRVGELQNLIWKHVDLDGYKQVIKVKPHNTGGEYWKPKNKASKREVELNPQAVEIIKRQQGNDPDFVFSLQGDGKMNYITIYQALKKFQKQAGVEAERIIHLFRETFACRLAMNGINIFTLKDLMGHESIKTTEKYITAFKSDKQDAVDSLSV